MPKRNRSIKLKKKNSKCQKLPDEKMEIKNTA